MGKYTKYNCKLFNIILVPSVSYTSSGYEIRVPQEVPISKFLSLECFHTVSKFLMSDRL
jgi:hypothetical protein